LYSFKQTRGSHSIKSQHKYNSINNARRSGINRRDRNYNRTAQSVTQKKEEDFIQQFNGDSYSKLNKKDFTRQASTAGGASDMEKTRGYGGSGSMVDMSSMSQLNPMESTKYMVRAHQGMGKLAGHSRNKTACTPLNQSPTSASYIQSQTAELLNSELY